MATGAYHERKRRRKRVYETTIGENRQLVTDEPLGFEK
jgi:hypothetical protein